MKNLLILGLLAVLLFSVSAGLSVWLNQPKPDAAEKDKDKDKDKPAKGKSGDPKESTDSPKAPPKVEPPVPGPESERAQIREREFKLKLRAEQMDVVIRDLQAQRESTEVTLRAVMNELKNATNDAKKNDLIAEDLKKKLTEIEPIEKKNLEKIAAMYDAMAPETAAPILKEMANTGRLDMAARIMVLMKERKVAPVLEAMGDPALALQILDRIRTLRTTTGPAAAPAPAPVIPAKGP